VVEVDGVKYRLIAA